jgi:integrase
MGELIAHFRDSEMPEFNDPDLTSKPAKRDFEDDDDRRSWSTKNRYDSILKTRIEPSWGKVPLASVVAGEVEKWLDDLMSLPRKKKDPEADEDEHKRLAAGSKAKVRNLMSVLFNHAIRWGIFPANPISGPARKAGVRQSTKREETPDILEIGEMRSILAELGIRDRAIVSLDMITGLRRGELAGLRWADIDFERLIVNVVRSVVDQRTGKCKTEASAKPVPIDQYTAGDLKAWRSVTKYRKSGDWVFATDSNRAGKDNRGKQPIWLAKIMQYHIQPLVKRLGINKQVGCPSGNLRAKEQSPQRSCEEILFTRTHLHCMRSG